MPDKKVWKKRYKALQEVYEKERVDVVHVGHLHFPAQPVKEGAPLTGPTLPILAIRYKGHVYIRDTRDTPLPTEDQRSRDVRDEPRKGSEQCP